MPVTFRLNSQTYYPMNSSKRTQYVLRPLSWLLVCALLTTSCQDHRIPGSPTSPAAVLAWNVAGAVAVTRMTNPATGFFILPHIESRLYAMMNLAMYDALNTIQRRNTPYALQTALVPDASPDPAVYTAAHDVLVAMLPEQKIYADSLYTALLATISSSDGKTKGIALGQAAAKAIIAKRTGDGSETAQLPFPIGNNPGDYQFTPPFDGPPFNGYYALAGWKDVNPFGLTAGSQFRPGPPPALTSAEYTTNFNDVKSLGGITGNTRTPEQTEIGLFWLESSPLLWGRVARTILATRSDDAWDTVRLLALLQMAEADGYIAMADGKFAYKYWRPITAIRLAATDNNPATTADAAWTPISFPNPPDADYPSGHSTEGGAAAAVLQRFFGTDAISFSITNIMGKTRTYTSFSQAATENSVSRVYSGYHFRNSALKGQAMGDQIGAYIVSNYLK